MKKFTVLFSLVALQSAYGYEPVLCGGSYYEFVDHGSGLSWADAKAAAESVDGHHLATITSAEVTDCIVSNVFPTTLPPVSGDTNAWIGGQQAPGGSEPDGGWGWVNGESWGYTNWDSVNPSDSGGQEDCLEIHVFTDLREPGEWNDYICGSVERRYYIIEWVSPVPAVTEWGLFVMGLLVISGATILIARRKPVVA